jgi:hypothetical protein
MDCTKLNRKRIASARQAHNRRLVSERGARQAPRIRTLADAYATQSRCLDNKLDESLSRRAGWPFGKCRQITPECQRGAADVPPYAT